MTKGKAALPFGFDNADDEQRVPPLRYATVPRQAGTGGMTLLFGVRKGGRTSVFSKCGFEDALINRVRV
jgi:hypothetical protein